jgi:hypothetical protein
MVAGREKASTAASHVEMTSSTGCDRFLNGTVLAKHKLVGEWRLVIVFTAFFGTLYRTRTISAFVKLTNVTERLHLNNSQMVQIESQY